MNKPDTGVRLRLITLVLIPLTLLIIWVSTDHPKLSEARGRVTVGRVTVDRVTVDRAAYDPTQTSCRFGAIIIDSEDAPWLDTVKAGWYMNISTYEPTTYDGAPFVPVVWVKQDRAANGNYLPSWSSNVPLTDQGLGKLINRSPGKLWLVGNEPDRGSTSGSSSQGGMYPDMYAQAYHDVYHFIKGRDPSARVAVAGVLQASPGRLQYLDMVWNSYQVRYGTTMPVDVWNMHIYIMPEALPDRQTPSDMGGVALGTDIGIAQIHSYDPDGWQGPLGLADSCQFDDVYCFAEHDDMIVFDQQIKAMRLWMKNHGLQDKPLIISEFSVLYGYQEDEQGCRLKDEYGNCFPPPRVANYLHNTFSYLENTTDPSLGLPADGYRLVQQSMWYSISSYPWAGHDSDLVDMIAGQLTPMGQAFKSYVQNSAKGVNLIPAVINQELSDNADGTVDAYLEVLVGNAGTIDTAESFQITFYKDAFLTQVIGQVTVPAGTNLDGCGQQSFTAGITWHGLGEGIHPFWIKVNSGSAPIPEQNYGDNVKSGFIDLGGFIPYFLPAIMR